ncbi:MAG TPA: hypothetical protein VGZ73_10910 [Bryobacteraceae bacterium]|jgi:hypothetical protein|nr:hypothetical protein [Bryobacteraceae bacterium]
MPQRPEHRFVLLIRHFFDRFFDAESLSPQGDPHVNVTQTLGILAVPSAFFVLVCRPLGLWGWDLVAVRYLFLSISMIVMGFIMVFEWDALFPDRRDYQILTPLPLRLSSLFLAKTVALGIFLSIFLVDVNFFGVLFWPGIDSGRNLLNLLGAHVAAMLAGGLFAALSIGALQGVLITVLSGKAYRRVSATLQTLLMAGLVMLLFLTPMTGAAIERLAKSGSPLIYYFPGYWFIGLYERMRPATHDAVLLRLGSLAVRGLWCAGGLFAATYLPFYRRHARKMLETPEPSPPGSGRFAAWAGSVLGRTLLGHPTESGVFHFIGQTMRRSVKHRLFLATYGGFGAALAVMTLRSDQSGLLRLSLTLSFVLVSGLRAAFNFPSELRANWAFQITETSDVQGYLTATRKWIVLCAVLPLFALLAPMEFACFRWTAALFHLGFGIALSVLLMEIMFFDFRKVPFTCSHLPGKVNLVGLSVLYILGFTTYSSTMADLESWLGGMPVAAALFFAAAASACWLLNRRRRRSSESWYGETSRAASLDYDDPGDPVVRTLGITQ